jgi:hypothetical protein
MRAGVAWPVAASNPGVAGGTPRITTVDLFITIVWLALSTFFGVGVVAIMTFAKHAPAIWRSLFFWLQSRFWSLDCFASCCRSEA